MSRPRRIPFYFLVTVLGLCFWAHLAQRRMDAGCLVYNSGANGVDGFYSELPGRRVYRRSSTKLTRVPDFFAASRLSSQTSSRQAPRITVSPLQETTSQVTFTLSTGRGSPLFTVSDKLSVEDSASNAEQTLDHLMPPASGWQAKPKTDLGPLVVTGCTPLRKTSAGVDNHSRGGLRVLISRPGTSLMLGLNLGAAWWLYAKSVPVERVAVSYEKFVVSKEYWRAWTASFAHYDIMHLLFNTMSLYNLGALEDIYGTAQYLSYSIALVVLTMIAAMVIYHCLIHRAGRRSYYSQFAVGYSCVLFALMTVATLRTEQYCPIPGMQQLCFRTYSIPLPSGGQLRLNAAPVFLVFLTSFIMPRASLVGHLAGVAMGYPVAWRLLDWLTPPALLAYSLLAIVMHKPLRPVFPEHSRGSSSHGSSAPQATPAALHQSRARMRRRLHATTVVCLTVLLGLSLLRFSWSFIPAQVGCIALGSLALWHDRSSSSPIFSSPLPYQALLRAPRSSQKDLVLLYAFYATACAACAIHELLTFLTLVDRRGFLLGSGLAPRLVNSSTTISFLLSFAHGCGLLLSVRRLQFMPLAETWLRILQVERRHNEDEALPTAFSGFGARLGGDGAGSGNSRMAMSAGAHSASSLTLDPGYVDLDAIPLLPSSWGEGVHPSRDGRASLPVSSGRGSQERGQEQGSGGGDGGSRTGLATVSSTANGAARVGESCDL